MVTEPSMALCEATPRLSPGRGACHLRAGSGCVARLDSNLVSDLLVLAVQLPDVLQNSSAACRSGHALLVKLL